MSYSESDQPDVDETSVDSSMSTGDDDDDVPTEDEDSE